MAVLIGFGLRHAGLLVFAASVLALGAAFVAQYGFGLYPCVLCIYQRWPYVVTGLLGLAAAAFVRRQGWRVALLALAGVGFAVGGGIAVFHVGVEQLWWEGTAACAGPTDTADSIEAMRAQLLARPAAACDEVPWDLFGISIAGWNVLASALFAAASFYAASALARGRTAA